MKHEIVYFDTNSQEIHSNVTKENGWSIDADAAWNEKLKLGFSWQCNDFDGMREVRIPRSSLREEGKCKFKCIIPDTGKVTGKEGDGSSLLIPFDSAYLSYCAGKESREFYLPIYKEGTISSQCCNMSLFGLVSSDSSFAVIVEDGCFDTDLRVRMNWGKEHLYTMDAVFYLRDFADEHLIGTDCVIRSRSIAGSWVAIGSFYRDYVFKYRKIKTLKEKMKDNPTLQYAAKAITIRFRHGVKTVPSPISHQTPENQPDMKVYLTFDMLGKIAAELKRQNVGPAELNLVGWNYGGHDGAWPKLFPVEERLGGEELMVKNILAIDKLGYPVSLHDCYTGAFELASEFGEFDLEDLSRGHDGENIRSVLLGGGLCLKICPSQSLKYARRNFARTSKLPIRGSYYCDVTSIMRLKKCYDINHPVTRQEVAEYGKELMRMQHDTFASSMSEGAKEWALPELDRAYSIGSKMDSTRMASSDDLSYDFDWLDEEIPLFELVYHGSLIYNVFRAGVNSIPGEDLYLRNFAYGGIPLYYFHHLFHPEWANIIGWDRDLRYTTYERLVKDVARIKRASDDTAKLAQLQTEFIDDFIKHSNTLTQTIYANGKSVWVNYADVNDMSSDGKTVPARDFIVV